VRVHILFYTPLLLYSRLYLIQIARRPIRKCPHKKTANQLTHNFTHDLTLLLFTTLPPFQLRSLDDKLRNAKLIKQLKNARAKASKASHAQCVFCNEIFFFFFRALFCHSAKQTAVDTQSHTPKPPFVSRHTHK